MEIVDMNLIIVREGFIVKELDFLADGGMERAHS